MNQNIWKFLAEHLSLPGILTLSFVQRRERLAAKHPNFLTSRPLWAAILNCFVTTSRCDAWWKIEQTWRFRIWGVWFREKMYTKLEHYFSCMVKDTPQRVQGSFWSLCFTENSSLTTFEWFILKPLTSRTGSLQEEKKRACGMNETRLVPLIGRK